MTKRVSDIVTTEEIKSWKNGDIITIKAGTGKGKSHMIKNLLYAWAKSYNKKILFLIHRSNCKNQFEEEILADNKNDIIDIRTYQHMESVIKKYGEYNFGKHDYIVCDEFHYFLADATFSKTTDMSLDAILNQQDKTRIFMSATGDYMKQYINRYRKLETIDYKLDIDYDFINELAFYYKDETLDFFMEESIKRNEKTIFFIQSAEKAYNLYKTYKKFTMFNCSEYNVDYYKYVDVDKVDNLLKNEKFEELCLITTLAMDAGVNIVDEDVKHIVVDNNDVGSLIQCIGRKRLQNKKDKIYLYIKNINNNQIGGMITQTQKKLEMADYFKEHGTDKYVAKYEREVDKSYIVYDTLDENGKYIKKRNDLMYFKNKLDILDLELMLGKGKGGYSKHIAALFGFTGNKRYSIIEEDFEDISLKEYLDSIVGKVMLTADDRKDLIKRLDVRSNGKQLKSLDSLNSAMRERKINFYVDKFETSRVINNKKKNYKSAWRLLKLVGK